MLVVVGVRPDSDLAAAAGAELSARGAIVVDRHMRTNLADVYAAGDCALTYHRLTGAGYFPLGTTAHKQGRIAAENALGCCHQFAGSLGTQVVKVFHLVAARTGLRDREAGGYDPLTLPATADDHKAYYPGSHPIHMRYTADRQTHRLLGLQLVGHLDSEIAKRIDIAATAIYNDMTIDGISDLDLSYTPPLGSPWDALNRRANVDPTSNRRSPRSPKHLDARERTAARLTLPKPKQTGEEGRGLVVAIGLRSGPGACLAQRHAHFRRGSGRYNLVT